MFIKFKIMKIFLLVLAFVSAYGTDAERLERIKAIAAPLFVEGMRECDRKYIVEYLSTITDYKTETEIERSFEDMEDIVARALAACPNIIPSSPLATQFNRDDADIPEKITGWARQFAVCGFSDVKPEDRDSLVGASKSLFDEAVDDFFVCHALANLQEFEDLSLRAELISLAKKHNLPNSLRARVVDMLDGIEVSDRADYDRILGLMPRVYQFLGKEWPQEGVFACNIYGVMRAIAKNITDESLQELMDYTKDFLGTDFDKSNCEWEPFQTRQQAFDAFGAIPAAIRNQFAHKARKLLGNSGQFPGNVVNAVAHISFCQTVEELDVFIDFIRPILPKDKSERSNFFGMFRMCKDQSSRALLFRQIWDLAANPEEERVTDQKQLNSVLRALQIYFWNANKRSALAIDLQALAGQLPQNQKIQLLKIIARFSKLKDRQAAVAMIKTLSWQGNDAPSFVEQMDFLQQMEEAGESIFGKPTNDHGFIEVDAVSLETFGNNIAKAKTTLTPDILLEKIAMANVAHRKDGLQLSRFIEDAKGRDACGQQQPEQYFDSDSPWYDDVILPSTVVVVGGIVPENINLVATMRTYDQTIYGSRRMLQKLSDAVETVKSKGNYQVLQRIITDGRSSGTVEVVYNPDLTIADMLRAPSSMCFLESGRHANGRMDIVITHPAQKEEKKHGYGVTGSTKSSSEEFELTDGELFSYDGPVGASGFISPVAKKVTIEGSEITGKGGKIAATEGTAEISGTDITNLDEDNAFEISATQALTIEHGILKGAYLLKSETGIHLENVVFVGKAPILYAENITFKNVRYKLDGQMHAINSLEDHYPLLMGVIRVSA
jgi:hypothetical protein